MKDPSNPPNPSDQAPDLASPNVDDRLLRHSMEALTGVTLELLAESRALTSVVRTAFEPADAQPDFHARRRMVVACLSDGRYHEAEDRVHSLLDEQWRAPENTYLLGIVALALGRTAVARRAIDQAFDRRSWLDEVSSTLPNFDNWIDHAIRDEPDWLWPRYRRHIDRFVDFGLTLNSVVTERYEHENVNFLQIGANDGQHDDPLHGWIKRFGWSGVLLEPLDDAFASLSETHVDTPSVTLLQAALGEIEGSGVMYVDPTRQAISSFYPDRNLLKMRSQVETRTVTITTFDALSRQHPIDDTDLLQIDTEGYDYEVLKLFDLDRRHPEVINMEFFALPLSERLATLQLLRDHGYAWRFKTRDLLAVDIATFAPMFGLVDKLDTEVT